MKAIAINGSPRKNWNTAQLLESALRGAQDAGAEIEMIHLYEKQYRGCISCFSCRRKNAQPCKCYMNDELSPVLENILAADVLFIGSPIYLGNVTGQTRAFLERLAFPAMTYDDYSKRLYEGRLNSAFFFTMNAGYGIYESVCEQNSNLLKRFNGSTEYYLATDTLQFDDYSKYQAATFDAKAKLERHKIHFPKELQDAYEIGKRLAQK